MSTRSRIYSWQKLILVYDYFIQTDCVPSLILSSAPLRADCSAGKCSQAKRRRMVRLMLASEANGACEPGIEENSVERNYP